MNYAEMTDFEINKAAANAAGYKLGSDFQSLLDEFSPGCVNVIIEGSQSTFNPCNSWDDAGPIIHENKISLIYDGDDSIEPPAEWILARHVSDSGEGTSYYGQPNNPLRAAMIVFLMMQEGK